MRIVAIVLAALLLLIQWAAVVRQGRVAARVRARAPARRAEDGQRGARERNAQLAAEVASLREGRGAIEERARHELNMVREGETFFQLIGSRADPVPPSGSR